MMFCGSKHFPILPEVPAFHLIMCNIWLYKTWNIEDVWAPLCDSYGYFCLRLVPTAIGPNECVPYVIFQAPKTLCSLKVEALGIRCHGNLANFVHH